MSLPDDPYLNKIKNIDYNPIFILGLHRSGTSILYKMLHSTGFFNSVSAYHIINYDELLSNSLNKSEPSAKNHLTGLIASKGQLDRGIDTLKITADFSEEYGFHLGKKSSVYHLTSKNLKYFDELAKKIQFISNNNKLLLLKNPWDLSNFLTIKSLIPNAKFIFIHRHPYRSISSFVKATRMIIKKSNPYSMMVFEKYKKTYQNPLLLFMSRLLFYKYNPLGILYLANIDVRSINYYSKNISKLSSNDFVEITYEELCKSPNETMKKLFDFLKISTKKEDFNSFINPRNPQLDPGMKFFSRLIYRKTKPYFDKFCYEKDI